MEPPLGLETSSPVYKTGASPSKLQGQTLGGPGGIETPLFLSANQVPSQLGDGPKNYGDDPTYAEAGFEPTFPM